MKTFRVEPGSPYQFGARMDHQGCNFALYSRHAHSVELVFFEKPQDDSPSARFVLSPELNRTGDVWHIYIYDVKPGQLYGYYVGGPYDPLGEGHRFNANKLLMDPYATAIVGEYDWTHPSSFAHMPDHPNGDASFNNLDNTAYVAKSAVTDPRDFDWEGDKCLNIPMQDSIIYEMHVRAFTKDPGSKVRFPGTYLGLVEKIPYLKSLGITTVELLPIHDFNPWENIKTDPVTGERLVNFWGYSTLNFFAPARWYASDQDGRTAVREFREMVKALHKAGIEVILDVVYNHTGEGNEYGPIHSFRGLDNNIYYMLENGRHYKNYSGCGNTLNCNHPVVRTLILDSLRYWVVDMHVDGFRFDLAAILGRDANGHWMPNHSVLNDIAKDPILSTTKIIAEGWDAAGLYQVGGFPKRWAEWNAAFRDDVRAWVKSDNGKVTEISKRLTGSADLFHYSYRRPYQSINFVTAHDGFTLHDLVSYNHKHNIRNAEDERDGSDHNLSWNCGVEGESHDPDVLELRKKQMKNFMTILLFSAGTPMLLSGDEMAFSKKGNNNTYCHDNELNWRNWELLEKNREHHEFVRYLIHLRKRHPTLRRSTFFYGRDNTGNQIQDITWYGVDGEPDWTWDSHCLACMLDGSRFETGAEKDDDLFYLAMNTYWEPKAFVLPNPQKGRPWHLCVDTAKSPGFWNPGEEPLVQSSYFLEPRSVIVLRMPLRSLFPTPAR